MGENGAASAELNEAPAHLPMHAPSKTGSRWIPKSNHGHISCKTQAKASTVEPPPFRLSFFTLLVLPSWFLHV